MITLKNNAQSLLAASLSAGDTSLRVSLGDGALFPDIPVPGADWFRAALSDNAGNTEYIKVTGKDGDVLTVVRGEEGSAAQAWTAGARIQVRMTAKTWEDMAQDHWTRLTAADGSIVIPSRLSDTALRVTGDWTKEAHARRALRISGSSTPLYISGSTFTDGATTITVSGTLPTHLPAIDLGIPQEMMPETLALSDAVNSTAQNVGASSQAVHTAYDKAVEARSLAAAAMPKTGGTFTGPIAVPSDVVVLPQDSVSEGGEIQLQGAGANTHVVMENESGVFRILRKTQDGTVTGAMVFDPAAGTVDNINLHNVPLAKQAESLKEKRIITLPAGAANGNPLLTCEFDGSGNASFVSGCAGNCSGLCAGSCAGTCTSCTGTCAGTCSSCAGSCTGTCTGSCAGGCGGTCTGGCGGTCQSRCTACGSCAGK